MGFFHCHKTYPEQEILRLLRAGAFLCRADNKNLAPESPKRFKLRFNSTKLHPFSCVRTKASAWTPIDPTKLLLTSSFLNFGRPSRNLASAAAPSSLSLQWGNASASSDPFPRIAVSKLLNLESSNELWWIRSSRRFWAFAIPLPRFLQNNANRGDEYTLSLAVACERWRIKVQTRYSQLVTLISMNLSYTGSKGKACITIPTYLQSWIVNSNRTLR